MQIIYPVASSSSVYYPSSSTSSTCDYSTTPSSTVVCEPVTQVKFYSKNGYYDDDDDHYTTVYDSPNNCYPTVTVTQTVNQAKATPVVTTLPHKPAQSEYTQYGGPAADSYAAPAWLTKKNATLKPSLSQKYTNGLSLLSTKDAPTYPIDWMPGKDSSYPWGTNVSVSSHSPSNHTLDTGMTRKYNFVVSYRDIAPDGVTKQGLVINGAFPGPTIQANWGTSIHWHGLLQKGTPWLDGVPTVSECPIPPGKTMTYRSRADQYGTSWYHSHYSAQYAGGALGAMIIHGPRHADYDVDLGPIILSDWYHKSYLDLVEATMTSIIGLPPWSDNNLIQGKGNYPCAITTQYCVAGAGIAKFFFKTGKKYRLRLINTGSDGLQKFWHG
ncbi:hypothetical protein EG327_010340 [Venturia inaequalis]|uniref:Uncharacterized protein n=1 Tax=Venturia inaequalis TaxID=5025 RepID=A0A8H3VP99_VENIN|nr:hypothetical protein EG327_010340 [Venturia inaequalis]